MPAKNQMVLKTVFNQGELTPRLWGRLDSQVYQGGLKTLKNAVALPQGGVMRRSGFRYIAACKNADKAAILVRFQYSTEQAYILEFGDQYVRVFKDLAPVESGGSPVEVATTYLEAELSGLRFAQSADVLFIVHPDHAPATLSRTSDTSWTLADITFTGGPFLGINSTATTLTPSGTTGSVTLTASAALFDADHVGALFKLIHPTGTETVSKSIVAAGSYSASLSIEAGTIDVAASSASWGGTTVTVERSYDGGSTWTDVAEYTSDTTATLTETSTGILYRIGCQTGEYGGTAVSVSLSQVKSEDFGIARVTAVTDSTHATATVETAFADTSATLDWNEGAWSAYRGYPSLVTFYEDRLLFAANANQPQTVWGSQTGDYYNFLVSDDLADSDSVQYTLLARQMNAIRWMEPDVKLRLGTADSEWYMAGTDYTEPITPSSVRVRQETHYGSAAVQPLRVADSVFYVRKDGRVLLESAYDYSSDGYVSRDLAIIAEHLTRDYTLTQLAYQQYPFSVVWGVREDGALIGLTYQKEHQVYAWHRHDTEGTIESIAVLPSVSGDDELWAVVNRTVNGATVRYVEVLAAFFSGTDSEGAFFVDCGASYGAWNETTTYLATLTASTWEAGDSGTLTMAGYAPFTAGDVGNSWRLRSGADWCEVTISAFTSTSEVDVLFTSDVPASLQSTATSDWIELVESMSGLDHLEGETVQVLADGGPHADCTVSGGAIALDYPAGVIHAGLGYDTDIETLPIGAVGTRRKIVDLSVRLDQTKGGQCGPDENNLKSFPLTSTEDYYDGMPPTYTGDLFVDYAGDVTALATVLFRQAQPLPFTLLAVQLTLEAFDR